MVILDGQVVLSSVSMCHLIYIEVKRIKGLYTGIPHTIRAWFRGINTECSFTLEQNSSYQWRTWVLFFSLCVSHSIKSVVSFYFMLYWTIEFISHSIHNLSVRCETRD